MSRWALDLHRNTSETVGLMNGMSIAVGVHMRKANLLLAAGVPLFANCPAPTTCGLMGGPSDTWVEPWDGGLVDGGSVTNGQLDWASCQQVCSTANACVILDAGLVQCHLFCVGGRVPPGLVSLSGVDASPGSWLARMAELEAAAVHAFMHLATELDAHGLPRFAAEALRAAEHEVRHATSVTRLALRYGYCPRPLEMRTSELRSLEAIAIDNAGEGCGRELFGSVLNVHQARTATDPAIAEVMTEIAAEEAEHAELSFGLAAELMPRLTVAQRRRAREAQEVVLEVLAGDEIRPAARGPLGLMDQAQALATSRALLDQRRL